MNCSLRGWNLRKNNAEWWFSPQAITRETGVFQDVAGQSCSEFDQ